jgi:hypothetical protein
MSFVWWLLLLFVLLPGVSLHAEEPPRAASATPDITLTLHCHTEPDAYKQLKIVCGAVVPRNGMRVPPQAQLTTLSSWGTLTCWLVNEVIRFCHFR